MYSWRRWVSTSEHLSVTSTGASLFTTRRAETYSLLPTDTSLAREQRREHRFPGWSLGQNEAFKPIIIRPWPESPLNLAREELRLWALYSSPRQNSLWKVFIFLSLLCFFTLVSLVQFRRSIFNMIFILGFRYYLKNTPSVLMIAFLRRWRKVALRHTRNCARKKK